MEPYKLIQKNNVDSTCTDVPGCIRNTTKFGKIAQYLYMINVRNVIFYVICSSMQSK